MGVEKVELAVMAELMLRGEQTVGDLRGRASRMEKIADVSELRPIVAGLIEKNLLIALTPPGRGQVVTHNLYLPDQLDKLKRQVGSTGSFNVDPGVPPKTATPATEPSGEAHSAESEDLKSRIETMEAQIARLVSEVNRLSELLA